MPSVLGGYLLFKKIPVAKKNSNCALVMEFSVLALLRESVFLEVVTVVVTIRILWSQLLGEDLSDTRGYPLLIFMVRKNHIRKNLVLSQLDMIRDGMNAELRSITKAQGYLRELVFRYNSLQRETDWIWWCIIFLAGIGISYYNPFILASAFLADLLIARIHHHILSSW